MEKPNLLVTHRKAIGIISLIFLLVVYLIWRHLTYFPSTNDAYVQANIVNIAAEVNGPVAEVKVKDHQAVKKGQLLFTIDPTPFQLAVDAARTQLTLTYQQVAGSEAGVQAAAALVAQRQAQLIDIQNNSQRYFTLVQKGLLSKAEGDNTKAKLAVAQAALTAAQSQLEQAKQQTGQNGTNNAQVQAAVTKLKQAELDLQHTYITAPSDGYLVNFNLRQGSMITSSQPLFALVENDDWWVEANFKETDLQRIHSMQPAKISLDIYPGRTFKGIVQQISAGSGAAFSLLPPENATGNWVKVTQRFPVRVELVNADPKYPLRVGASSTVTIDTRAR